MPQMERSAALDLEDVLCEARTISCFWEDFNNDEVHFIEGREGEAL